MVAVFVSLAVMLTGCSTVKGGPMPPLRVCGQTLWSGADARQTQPLDPPPADSSAAPTADILPSPVVESPSPAFLVRVSVSCKSGDIVTFNPRTAVTVNTVIRASDGHIAALAFTPVAAGELEAWHNGQAVGVLTFTAP